MRKTPERIERLAAEYVLGSLQGLARRRFERWMMESATVRREVWYWEQHVGALNEMVPQRQPPARVWQNIQQRLWPEPLPRSDVGPGRDWLLGGWSLLATAAALVLALVLVQQPAPPSVRVLTGAIVQAGIEDPLWVISEAAHEQRLSLRPVAAQAAAPGKDYELWIVPDDGQPLSLGVVPVGQVYRVTLDEAARQALGSSQTLAISLEPKGGSPTGAPTGPILHVTRLYEL
ncbi:anti-sigma factor [Marinobacter sp. SS21]|uniref:anti-sigma factor n=1 Tax=Marinobacter sp. SS21 TaxID=2979460 RepID=UPI00232B1C0B|nr:anti-sigma factor [Marinobacter sp. SS21]MDC0661142.1 anti-sigma factor [Marinobacter sp. SS21]